jgi:hypothetical protein
VLAAELVPGGIKGRAWVNFGSWSAVVAVLQGVPTQTITLRILAEAAAWRAKSRGQTSAKVNATALGSTSGTSVGTITNFLSHVAMAYCFLSTLSVWLEHTSSAPKIYSDSNTACCIRQPACGSNFRITGPSPGSIRSCGETCAELAPNNPIMSMPLSTWAFRASAVSHSGGCH